MSIRDERRTEIETRLVTYNRQLKVNNKQSVELLQRVNRLNEHTQQLIDAIEDMESELVELDRLDKELS